MKLRWPWCRELEDEKQLLKQKLFRERQRTAYLLSCIEVANRENTWEPSIKDIHHLLMAAKDAKRFGNRDGAQYDVFIKSWTPEPDPEQRQSFQEAYYQLRREAGVR